MNPEKKSFQSLCSVCGKIFTDEKALFDHETWHKNVKTICREMYYILSKLKSHLEHHQKIQGNPYLYSIPGLQMNTECGSQTEDPYTCKLCRASFKSILSFKQHWKIHTGEKPYICDKCGESFSQDTYLEIHETQHMDDGPFICDICNQEYLNQNILRIHLRTHDYLEVTNYCVSPMENLPAHAPESANDSGPMCEFEELQNEDKSLGHLVSDEFLAESDGDINAFSELLHYGWTMLESERNIAEQVREFKAELKKNEDLISEYVDCKKRKAEFKNDEIATSDMLTQCTRNPSEHNEDINIFRNLSLISISPTTHDKSNLNENSNKQGILFGSLTGSDFTPEEEVASKPRADEKCLSLYDKNENNYESENDCQKLELTDAEKEINFNHYENVGSERTLNFNFSPEGFKIHEKKFVNDSLLKEENLSHEKSEPMSFDTEERELNACPSADQAEMVVDVVNDRFICPYCREKFIAKSKLKIHIRKRHGIEEEKGK